MYAAIGRRIRRLRKALKMTQEELAEKAGISLSFLGHIERGSRKASIETLYKLMKALNCTANDLFGSIPGEADNEKLSDQLLEIAYKLQKEGR